MKRPKLLLSSLIILGLVALAPSCSNSPTETPVSPDNQATGRIDPNQSGGVLLGTVATNLPTAMIEVWAQNLTVESDSTVSFDAVLVNKCNCPVPAPIHFVITHISPDAVHVINADMDGPDGPVFDFSDDVGDDNILGPLESSDPVKMLFQWPGAMSFAIAFRVDTGPSTGGTISGVVFNDLNGNGTRENNENGVPGIIVQAKPSTREIILSTRTDANGHYVIRDLTADVYSVEAHAGLTTTQLPQPTTPNPLLVTLVKLPDGTVSNYEHADFGFLFGPIVPPGPPIPVFGPVNVGPGSSYGTVLDTTFTVPLFFAPVNLFLVVMDPPLAGPMPLIIRDASVEIDGQLVWEFHCPPPDSIMCEPPPAKVPLDLMMDATTMDHKIRITTEGEFNAFLMYSIIAENVARAEPQ